MISAIVLSAGKNTRFGSPKALAELTSLTVIETLLQTLLNSQVTEIIVVLGSSAEDIKPYLLKHKTVKVVYNKDYNLGQTSSFKTGLRNISSKSTGILLLPVDYPLVHTQTIDHIIDKFISQKPLIVLPTHDRKRGHPPLFSTALRDEFQQLDDSVGINTVLHEHDQEIFTVPVDDIGVISTFNTPREFEEIKSLRN